MYSQNWNRQGDVFYLRCLASEERFLGVGLVEALAPAFLVLAAGFFLAAGFLLAEAVVLDALLAAAFLGFAAGFLSRSSLLLSGSSGAVSYSSLFSSLSSSSSSSSLLSTVVTLMAACVLGLNPFAYFPSVASGVSGMLIIASSSMYFGAQPSWREMMD